MISIYLIGMMGCGKTTCAGLLGKKLGWQVVDTDAMIQERAGCTISQIFAQHGEQYFRQLETELLWELSGREDLVVSCGGGLPLRAENRAILRECGRVVFLNRDPGEIYDTGDMSARPLAQDGRQAFIDLFHQREPLYRAAATVVVEDFSSPEHTVEEILKVLKG